MQLLQTEIQVQCARKCAHLYGQSISMMDNLKWNRVITSVIFCVWWSLFFFLFILLEFTVVKLCFLYGFWYDGYIYIYIVMLCVVLFQLFGWVCYKWVFCWIIIWYVLVILVQIAGWSTGNKMTKIKYCLVIFEA